jgi:hypothetical protein
VAVLKQLFFWKGTRPPFFNCMKTVALFCSAILGASLRFVVITPPQTRPDLPSCANEINKFVSVKSVVRAPYLNVSPRWSGNRSGRHPMLSKVRHGSAAAYKSCFAGGNWEPLGTWEYVVPKLSHTRMRAHMCMGVYISSSHWFPAYKSASCI